MKKEEIFLRRKNQSINSKGMHSEFIIYKNTGITLISLVVTIVVLIILATVSMNAVFSENGIIRQAEKAKETTVIAEEKDSIYVSFLVANLSEKDKKLETLKKQLVSRYGEENIEVYDSDEKYEIAFFSTNRYYEIDDNGNLEGPMRFIKDKTPGILDGTGTENDPYVIMSIEDLVYFSQQVNETKNTYENKYVVLGKTLDFHSNLSYINPETTEYDEYLGGDGTTTLKEQLTQGNGFRPIGIDPYFKGKFNGENEEIRNLYVNNTTLNHIGLFGGIEDTEIKNIRVTGNIISSKDSANIGGIIGTAKSKNFALISNCYSKVEIKDTATTGGLIGGIVGNGTCNDFIIEKCYYDANIQSENSKVGGIVGKVAKALIKECYNKGEVLSVNGACGGIVGIENYSAFTIEKCTNLGRVKSENAEAGGIGGSLIVSGTANINQCTNEGEVIGYNYVGGIIGYNWYGSLTIQNCYNIGNIKTNESINATVGGIAGDLFNSNVINCYNTGEVKGGAITGGIVGTCYFDTPVTLVNCWNSGNILNNSDKVRWICRT